MALALELVLLSFAFELRQFYAHMPKLQFVDAFLATPIQSVGGETPKDVKKPGISVVFARTLTGSAKISDSSQQIPRPQIDDGNINFYKTPI